MSDLYKVMTSGNPESKKPNPKLCGSDEFWEHEVRAFSMTVYHPVGMFDAT